MAKARKEAGKKIRVFPPWADVFVINKYFLKMQKVHNSALNPGKPELNS
ncbi:hypothetical protein D1AOALGA4SA_12646 [Olavius algarvensis Delta 1 endosymbiont]|nr:hypothetical protein D1AOALGA4SA_12646 [Olavius algarvensis Delta 1 endosymbiont]